MRKSLEARILEGISRGWRMMNPYNEAEIRDVAPTVTCGVGGLDCSSTVLIVDYEDKEV